MPITTDLVHIVNEKANKLIKLIAPYIKNKKAGVVSLSAAVVLTLLYNTFQKFNRPARKLNHLPHVTFFSLLNYSIRDKLYETYSRELVMPLITKSNGVYIVSTKLKNTRFAVTVLTLITSETHYDWVGC
jgi:hypothetical protein